MYLTCQLSDGTTHRIESLFLIAPWRQWLQQLASDPSLRGPPLLEALRSHAEEYLLLSQTFWGEGIITYDHVAGIFNTWARETGEDGVKKRTYDEAIQQVSFLHEDLAALILPCLAPAAEILDVGCGSGCLGARFVAHRHVVDGIDIAEEMLRDAQQRGYRKLGYHNIATAPYISKKDPQRYDAVVSFGVFGEWVPTETGVRNSIPALKEHGVIGFSAEREKTDLETTIALLQREGFSVVAVDKTKEIKNIAGIADIAYYYVIATRK